MLKKYSICLVFVCVLIGLAGADGAVIFSEDFASAGTTSTYVNASPDSGQWNAISTTGAAKVWAISSDALSLTSTGANAAYVSRTTDFSTQVLGLQVSFTFEFLGSTTALTSAFNMALGSGFGTANSNETNANTYAKFGLNFTVSDGFVVRDITGGTNGAATYGLGSYTFTWVLNNTGSSFSYVAPDGTTETLANDTWDLWVGTSKQLNDRAVTTASQSITDWKFGADGSGTYSAAFDNFVLTTVPEPSSIVLAGLGAAFLLYRRKRKTD